MENREDKELERARSQYFQDLKYSNQAPQYGEPTPETTPLGQSEKNASKRGWSFVPALLGALIGGILVGAILLTTLYFTGNLKTNRTYEVSSEAAVNYDGEAESAASAVEAVAQVVPKSVVGISATGETQGTSIFGQPQSQAYSSTGSGFFVTEDGYIATNQHVTVDNNSSLTVSLFDGSEHEAKLVWSDASLDIAILKIDVTGAQAVEFGDSDTLKVGQTVVAVGNPLGLTYSRSVTAGIISAIDRSLVVEGTLVAEGLIQTDAAINSGNSGGPLVNANGQVIGINTYKQPQGEAMGFAIPINLFKPIIQEVIETGSFSPMVIGITGYDPEQARYMTNGQVEDFSQGIYILEVTANSPAQAAGLQQGDIIKSIDDKSINTMLQLRTILYSHKDGDKVKIVYTRGGKENTTEMTLAKQK